MIATYLLVAAYAPLVLLIYLMVKPNGMASSKALPLCALVAYLLVIFQGHSPLAVVHASVIQGALLALTPLSIIADSRRHFSIFVYGKNRRTFNVEKWLR